MPASGLVSVLSDMRAYVHVCLGMFVGGGSCSEYACLAMPTKRAWWGCLAHQARHKARDGDVYPVHRLV